MRKLLAAVMATGLMFGGAFAIAEAAPGPNGNNDHGLCTAFFNGQKKGHDKNGNPPPFAALIEAADDDDEDTPPAEDVYNYCQAAGIGGNPENGRYPEYFGEE
jgi:hypothetical protein